VRGFLGLLPGQMAMFRNGSQSDDQLPGDWPPDLPDPGRAQGRACRRNSMPAKRLLAGSSRRAPWAVCWLPWPGRDSQAPCRPSEGGSESRSPKCTRSLRINRGGLGAQYRRRNDHAGRSDRGWWGDHAGGHVGRDADAVTRQQGPAIGNNRCGRDRDRA
jgi:hypothetical protein